MAEHDAHESHGRSPAAWTAVYSLLVGCAFLAVGVALFIWWPVIVGVVICALGMIAGRVLSMAGFGVHGQARRAEPGAASTHGAVAGDVSGTPAGEES